MHINWYTISTVALGVFYSGFAGTETQRARFLGLCLACLKSCDQQWNHTVEQFCPSSSLAYGWAFLCVAWGIKQSNTWISISMPPSPSTVPHAFLNFVSGWNS